MFCKTNTQFYTQGCKVGCFLYYLGKTLSEKSLDFCNISHGFVSKWKKNKIMKNLICKVGLLIFPLPKREPTPLAMTVAASVAALLSLSVRISDTTFLNLRHFYGIR